MRHGDIPDQRVVAVVVTHNRIEHLRKTLSALLDAPSSALSKIVVFDNASLDGTNEWLSSLNSDRIDVVSSVRNLGGAGGFEFGMRHAVKHHDPDWLVVMDDDARPMAGTLMGFLNTDRTAGDLWAAAVYHPDGTICEMNRPSLNPFWHWRILLRTIFGKGRDGFHLGPTAYHQADVRAVDGASFVGLFISRKAIEVGGYPDGRLFIYGDDVLYTLQLRSKGMKIFFDPRLHFEHDISTFSGGLQRFNPLWKTYYHYRNLLMVYRYCAPWFFVVVGPAAILKWLLKTRHHKGQQLRYVSLVCRAARDGALSRLSVDFSTVKDWSGENATFKN